MLGVKPEVGKVYNVNHSRKGKFKIQVTAIRDEWIDGNVVEGVALAVSANNPGWFPGEPITVRASFCVFSPADER